MVFVAAAMLVVAAAAIPQVLVALNRSRGYAAARYLAAQAASARILAVSRGQTMALRFEEERDGIAFRMYRDGNRNGVLMRDIARGIDPPVDQPVLLADHFPGTAIGVTPDSPATDAVQLGGTRLLSFTSIGTSTSGTVYVRGRDGTQWAVRVLGATGRTRLLRYDVRAKEWVAPY